MRIRNLSGAITGQGFKKKSGRHIGLDDLGWTPGPIDIKIEDGKIVGLEKSVGPNQDPHPMDIDGTGYVATSAFFESHAHPIFSGTRAWEYFERWQGQSYQDIAARGGGIKSTFQKTAADLDQNLVASTKTHLAQWKSFGVAMAEAKSGYGPTAEQEFRLMKLLAQINGAIPFKKTFLGLHAIPQGFDQDAWTTQMIALLPSLKKNQLMDFVDAFPEAGFFTLDNSLRFARSAKDLGVPCKIHCDELSSLGSAEAFSALGSVSVDHLQKISEVGIQTLAQSNTVATLLPATSFYLGLEYAPARRLLDQGAQVALATDFNPGTAPNQSPLFTGLLAACQMKMQPHEIWCALTFNGAAALGESHQHGALLNGYHSTINLWKTASLNPVEIVSQVIVEQLRPVKLGY